MNILGMDIPLPSSALAFAIYSASMKKKDYQGTAINNYHCSFLIFLKMSYKFCWGQARNFGSFIVCFVSSNDKLNLTFFCGYKLNSVLKILPAESQCAGYSRFNNRGNSKKSDEFIHNLINVSRSHFGFSKQVENIGQGNSSQYTANTLRNCPNIKYTIMKIFLARFYSSIFQEPHTEKYSSFSFLHRRFYAL